MKPPPFEYLRAASLDEALALLAEAGDDAKPLAGGQSLVPLLNMRFVRPSLLVDLNGIAGLDGIERENGSVRIGALARQDALTRSQLVREPAAARARRAVHRPLRHTEPRHGRRLDRARRRRRRAAGRASSRSAERS